MLYNEINRSYAVYEYYKVYGIDILNLIIIRSRIGIIS